MKIIKLGASRIIISNPESYHNYFAWPSVARLQNGKIAVVCSGYRVAHICPFGKTVIAYSEDNGETYTTAAPVIDTILDDRDAGIVTFGESSVLVTSFNLNWDYLNGDWVDRYKPYEKYVSAYADFVPKEKVKELYASRYCVSNNYGITFGEKFKAPITSPHGPTVLKNGSILWIGTNYESNKGISAYKIFTNGEYEFIGAIGDICDDGKKLYFCEPHAIELDDGTIICHIRAHIGGGMTIYQSESYDGGKSWSKPHCLINNIASAPAYLMKHSSGAIISSYGYRGEPAGIRMMISYDGAKTWDTDNIIFETDTGDDLGYPSTIELSDGSLLTVFYAHAEKDGPAVIMQQKWKLSDE